MIKYLRQVAERAKGEEGATAVEYGLLVAAIAAVIVLVVFALGTYVKGAFKQTCTAMQNGGITPATSGTTSPTCTS